MFAHGSLGQGLPDPMSDVSVAFQDRTREPAASNLETIVSVAGALPRDGKDPPALTGPVHDTRYEWHHETDPLCSDN